MTISEKKRYILGAASEGVEVRRQLIEDRLDDIVAMACGIARVLKKGGTIYLAGNGGSAADAEHFATEMVVRLAAEFDRPSLPAAALTTNTSLLTAAANDYGFDRLFERQVEGLVGKKDLLLLISTSGNSPNLLRAAEIAHRRAVPVFALLGSRGGKLRKRADLAVIVPSDSVQRIQEEHIFIIHTLVYLVERDLFG
jgi:D-sedoheptulose 7-phosphate isomerase